MILLDTFGEKWVFKELEGAFFRTVFVDFHHRVTENARLNISLPQSWSIHAKHVTKSQYQITFRLKQLSYHFCIRQLLDQYLKSVRQCKPNHDNYRHIPLINFSIGMPYSCVLLD